MSEEQTLSTLEDTIKSEPQQNQTSQEETVQQEVKPSNTESETKPQEENKVEDITKDLIDLLKFYQMEVLNNAT